MLTRLAAICLLVLASARPGLTQNASTQNGVQQNAPDIQKVLDRLAKLEEQNRQIVEEIHALRAELRATPPPATPSPDVNERLDVQESRTSELAQTRVEASQKFPVSLTGMLLFNAFANGKYSGANEYPTAATLVRGAATSGGSLRQTILGLKFSGPDLPGGGKVSGSLYMDFFAGSQAPFNNLLHIRVARLDLAWKNTTISVGQDKPIISPRDPTSLAQVGVSPLTAAGNLWDWQPQVRLEQRFALGENTGVLAQAGVYQTAESYPGAQPPVYAGTLEKARPGYEGRVEFFTGTGSRRLEIAPGFHFSTTHVDGASVPSQIVSLDWLARPVAMVEFTGEFFHGQNVAGLGARQGFDILPSGGVLPVHSQGEWGQVALFPAARLSFHIYAGEQADRASDLAAGSVSRNFVYAGNLIYKLAPNVLAALEVSQARTQYLGSLLRLNNHYDLALAYLF